MMYFIGLLLNTNGVPSVAQIVQIETAGSFPLYFPLVVNQVVQPDIRQGYPAYKAEERLGT